MAVLDIVHYGDPLLRKKCDSVQNFDQLDSLLEDMFDSMYEADGIGLAANQVGVDQNLFIIDVTHTEEADEPLVFINSEILSKDGEEGLYQEGCLSLPGIALDVKRPSMVALKYQTPNKKWHEKEFSGILGRAIQHEMDHLNGVFIIDRVSKLERIQYKKELKDLENNSKAKLKTQSGKKGFVL